MILQPGYIGLTRGWDGIAKAILKAQQVPGESPSRMNHALMISKGGILERSECIEALFSGTDEHSMIRYRRPGADQVLIYRMVDMTPAQANMVVMRARQEVGKRYGWDKVAAALADRVLFGGRVVVRRWTRGDRTPDCSIVVALGLDAIRYRFRGMDPKTVEPDDIDDDVRNNDRWECVGQIN